MLSDVTTMTIIYVRIECYNYSHEKLTSAE